jgi:hypothetical protein
VADAAVLVQQIHSQLATLGRRLCDVLVDERIAPGEAVLLSIDAIHFLRRLIALFSALDPATRLAVLELLDHPALPVPPPPAQKE